MESDFRAILIGHASLIALVPKGRIYPGNYAQGAASPAIRYAKVSGVTGLHLKGSDGLSETLMQIDVRSAVRPGVAANVEVLAVRDVLVALLHPYRGLVGTTDFRLIHLNNDRGVDFEKTDATQFYTTSLDFTVFSRVAA
jgi:hypothetical protein